MSSNKVTAMEEMTFETVIGKLASMHPDARRRHPCWSLIRKLALETGNWKARARGKPDIRNLNGKPDHGFDTAY